MEFNVKDYGALGDGISNDTQAFIAASAALSAHGGGVLRIPQGVYVVGEQTLAGQLGLVPHAARHGCLQSPLAADN